MMMIVIVMVIASYTNDDEIASYTNDDEIASYTNDDDCHRDDDRIVHK